MSTKSTAVRNIRTLFNGQEWRASSSKYNSVSKCFTSPGKKQGLICRLSKRLQNGAFTNFGAPRSFSVSLSQTAFCNEIKFSWNAGFEKKCNLEKGAVSW